MLPRSVSRVRRTRQALALATMILPVFILGCSESTQVSQEEAIERTGRGIEAISNFDYPSALHILRPVAHSLPQGSPEWTRGTFALASAYRYAQPVTAEHIQHSRELFRLVAREGSDPSLRTVAKLELARELELANYPGDDVKLEEARRMYREIAGENAGSPLADEAILRLANTYFTDEAQADSAVLGEELITNYLQAHPESEFAVVMWQRLGTAAHRLKRDPAAALRHFQQAHRLGFAVPSRADNDLWMMSQLAEQTGQLKLAAELYRALLLETPRAFEITLAHRRLQELKEAHPEWDLQVPPLPVIQLEPDNPASPSTSLSRAGATESTPPDEKL